MGRGECDVATGKCACVDPFFGPQCEFQKCPYDCRTGGWCDLLTGKCLCRYGSGGESCRQNVHCDAEGTFDNERDWYTLWDQPGWALCQHGQALTGLYRSKCDMLSCLNSARCSGLCLAGLDAPLEVRHCYHSLKWYDSFDEAGWSSCDTNYYASGFYRSCNSLYCLQMAKCCSYKGTRWAQCEDTNWGVEWKERDSLPEKGWVKTPDSKWLTALHRTEKHLLKDLDNSRACGFALDY